MSESKPLYVPLRDARDIADAIKAAPRIRGIKILRQFVAMVQTGGTVIPESNDFAFGDLLIVRPAKYEAIFQAYRDAGIPIPEEGIYDPQTSSWIKPREHVISRPSTITLESWDKMAEWERDLVTPQGQYYCRDCQVFHEQTTAF